MTRAVTGILRRYGRPATLYGDGTVTAVRCLIQPLLYKNRVFLRDTMTELGELDEGHFLYIGPPETALCKDGYLVCGTRCFDILRGEPVYLGDAVSHWCAVLRPRPEEEES